MIAGLAADHLFVSGMVHDADTTIHLLSPAEPGFWAHVTATPEFRDGGADPLDRWSTRVIGDLARRNGGRAVFPFGGPPFAPFYDWALRSGQFFAAPMRFLVHPAMGLWSSLRGAIVLPGLRPLPPPATHPCSGCPAPCATACPVNALDPAGYDLAACHGFLAIPAENGCLAAGCRVRGACPISHAYGRLPEQSAWHMRHFHK